MPGRAGLASIAARRQRLVEPVRENVPYGTGTKDWRSEETTEMNGFIPRARRLALFVGATMVASMGAAQETALPPEHTPPQSSTEAYCESCDSGCQTCAEKPKFFKMLKQKWHDFDKEQLHPDHCWPDQYVRESQRRIYAPLGQQMVNGHRLESTIWEHYFDADDPAVLTEGGMARLRYLARRRPYVIPQLELQTSFDQEIDRARIEAVTEYAARVSTVPISWNVILTNRGAPIGLFGAEGPKTIDNMIGLPGAPPRHQPYIKQTFLSGDEDD